MPPSARLLSRRLVDARPKDDRLKVGFNGRAGIAAHFLRIMLYQAGLIVTGNLSSPRRVLL